MFLKKILNVLFSGKLEYTLPEYYELSISANNHVSISNVCFTLIKLQS